MHKFRNDFILISILTFISVLSLVLYLCLQRNENLLVYIYYEDHIVDVSPLYDTKELTINDVTIVIDRGSVSVKYSACKDQICVRQGGIYLAGQTITCLPQRIFIQIHGGAVDIGI